ncbi:MAG: hypothetical protein Q8S03_11040 [Brevundimonas sp.]|uniref:hypothetical protein n=1 Tax=Brevundimonas sp. TaxID=1871086 RepID=UPI002736C9F8|nr:hypothetical protein [Brevundimonas sp.]MDP3405218.1 hypothetical protein [Brevundimonas sp.]
MTWRPFLRFAPLLAITLSIAPMTQSASRAEWLPLPAQSLEINPGSPLDFSGLTPSALAGSEGALTLTPEGELRFTVGSGPVRFNCAVISNGPTMTSAFPTHAEADRMAQQHRLHGYTLARFHFADMRLAGRGQRADFEVDPEQLDRFYYLLAALKRNGVYWMIDGLTHPRGSKADADWDSPRSPNDLKIRLNFDPVAQSDWLKIVDSLYGRTNPYTGLTILADPALAFVVGANENSIVFWSALYGRPGALYPTGIAERFDRWVRTRAATGGGLAQLIPDASAAEISGGVPVAGPTSWDDDGPRMRQFLTFIAELEVGSQRWMTDRLKERGFQGPVLGFSEWFKQQDNSSRSQMPVTDLHSYVGEVTSYAAGSRLVMPSTAGTGMGSWLNHAAGRWLDRPLVSSEYGQAYPNPYRYEAGLIFPALSALQGYSAICRHAHLSVEPAIPEVGSEARAMMAYSIGLDPVARAGETLATLLFYRGDVAPAQAMVAVPFGADQFGRPGSAFLPLSIRRAALLTRFGLIAPDKVETLPASARIVAATPAPYRFSEKVMDRLIDMVTGSALAQQERLVAGLRRDGVLAPSNRTDPAKGVFQSSTGQLTLESRRGLFQVVTPRTEAVSVAAPAVDMTLGVMTVRRVDRGALIAASSLDGQPLSTSRKVLLILTGGAENTGMALDGTGETRFVKQWGTWPILIERVVADIELRSPVSGRGRLSVLDLRGDVIGQTEVIADVQGRTRLQLDIGAVPQNPTTFFLWERLD